MPKRPRRRSPNEPVPSDTAAPAAAAAEGGGESSGDTTAAQRTAYLQSSLTQQLLGDAGGEQYSAQFALEAVEDTRAAAAVQTMDQVRSSPASLQLFSLPQL